MSIAAISFYWGIDTPGFVTWPSRLAAAPDTPGCIVIHGGQFTGGVDPPNQFVPEIVSTLPCSPALVRHTLLIVYFFKELISFIGFLDKCHTSVFNALIFLARIIIYKSKTIIFSFQMEIIITSPQKNNKISTNNFKIDIKSTCDRLEMYKNNIST